ncbi:MAG: hypothetical protein FWF20_07060 [Betaproteobacteria bacterium]|nr:hypothetical protein [Betaproteobacteria bacterium]MCL2886528.1 hypothetical protein [Betaproteobacteria bacterium]
MDIPTLLSTANAVAELGGLLVKERDRQKAAAIQADFTNKLLDLQSKLSEVLVTVIEQQGLILALQQRIRELEAEAAEKDRYELAKVGSQGQFFAYRLRRTAELEKGGGDVEHFICQPCFEGGKKIALVGNGDGYFGCPVCKHGAQVEPGTPACVSGRRDDSLDLRGY